MFPSQVPPLLVSRMLTYGDVCECNDDRANPECPADTPAQVRDSEQSP